ncbi:DUF2255 family protein [Nocardioides insulae]|uniref:DUF2255 family protein n=1 Tax=Nocardioides insulae TaxID=394734 RepID=UPI0004291663|nr:DUF2255 family protein [Nocardioides insulae]
MTEWNPEDLSALADAGEIDIAAYRADGSLRSPRIVWHVAVDGSLYLRSVRGEAGAWYQGVRATGHGVIEGGGDRAEVTFSRDDSLDDAIDRAYHDKYGDGSPVRAITSPAAVATTLRVDPR